MPFDANVTQNWVSSSPRLLLCFSPKTKKKSFLGESACCRCSFFGTLYHQIFKLHVKLELNDEHGEYNDDQPLVTLC